MARFRVKPMVTPTQLAVNALLLTLCAHALWAALLVPCRNQTADAETGSFSRGVMLLNGIAGDVRFTGNLRSFLAHHDPAGTSASAAGGYNSLLPQVCKYGTPAGPVTVQGVNPVPLWQEFCPFAPEKTLRLTALPPASENAAAFPRVLRPQLRDDAGRELDCSGWDPAPAGAADKPTLLALTLTNGVLRAEVIGSCGNPELDHYALVQLVNRTRPQSAGIVAVSWPFQKKER